MSRIVSLSLLLTLAMAEPAAAGNKLISPGGKVLVARSKMSVKPASEWNKLSERPGKSAETWTVDGGALNAVTFYGGIIDGKTLFAEVDKRNKPLPRVSTTMLMTDIPGLFENSYRIALDTPLISIDSVEPVRFAGARGVRFTYSFTRQNEDVHRQGEARAAMINGALYMITYEAPSLHYFAKSIAAFRQLADSASF